ncbi:hypothetical protein LBMAG53_04760 [Planctomycetota bacterium]|nr:hypothetical protein LBMAG53_04760 [Planctomycetota bacterium]
MLLALSAQAAEIGELVVNNHVQIDWQDQPVSTDLVLTPARPISGIGAVGAPSQVEVLDGTPAAASRVRVWALVSVAPRAQIRLKIRDDVVAGAPAGTFANLPIEEVGGIPLVEATNGRLRVRLPLASAAPGTTASGTWVPPTPRSAFLVPGPALPVTATWSGPDWIDSRQRISAIEWQAESGPVYLRWKLTYRTDAGKSWVAEARLTAKSDFVVLSEACGFGDDSRWIIDLGGLGANRFHFATDAKFNRWSEITPSSSSADEGQGGENDFISVPGSKCLTRMTIWSQFNYIRGKQEALGVWAAPPEPPTAPATAASATAASATTAEVIAASPSAPAADTTAPSPVIGGFIVRPDRWTRAKLNHVALWKRPQVGGDRVSRGVVGLPGAAPRLAYEATLIDGHREWALYAKPSTGPSKDPWYVTQHIRYGIWPLDRLNRLVLAWNADGSPVAPEHAKPTAEAGPFIKHVASVLLDTKGRCGLQHFNGSNPSMRGGYAKSAAAVAAWAAANPTQRSAADLQASGKLTAMMAEPALAAALAMDDSAYPGERATLPWSDPEALNPFYQGMENMNFNVDRYESVLKAGEALEALGCPTAPEIFADVRREFECQLVRYVYPRSGLWEESHNYAGSALSASDKVGTAIGPRVGVDYNRDPRVLNLHRVWTTILSPKDPAFGGRRIVPPIGDHGLGVGEHVPRLTAAAKRFQATGDPAALVVAGELAWSMADRGYTVPDGVAPIAPKLPSRWIEGYGTTLRSGVGTADESYVIVRAGMSWGHHHQDKGSLWVWLNGIHFLGDAAWGGPPGEHYWNPYKQGPAGHSTLELVGVNNWPLPCKYPTPWIADDWFGAGADWTLARCRYPYNPEPDASAGTPPALVNGFDRHVLFIHPDLIVVRDAVESPCATIWHVNSLQGPRTTVTGAQATLASPQGLTGDLAILHPAGAVLDLIPTHERDMDDRPGTAPHLPFGSATTPMWTVPKDNPGPPAPEIDTRTVNLEWKMPLGSSATWFLGARKADHPAVRGEVLDGVGRVVRLSHPDGRVVTAFLGERDFTWTGDGITFAGRTGAVVRSAAGVTVHRIRCERLDAK